LARESGLRGADDLVNTIKKTLKPAVLSLITILATSSIDAQPAFQNLNFEQANPISAGNPFYPYLITSASGLPYWTVSYGNVQQTQIPYNAPSTGATWVTLIGPGSETFGESPIDGNYSVLLTGGGTPLGASISQTGLIPPGTQSLLFEAQPEIPGFGLLDVSIGGENVPFFAVGTGSDYTLYGVNITAWADQTEQLTFSAPSGSSY
jgi:hypothetical protein